MFNGNQKSEFMRLFGGAALTGCPVEYILYIYGSNRAALATLKTVFLGVWGDYAEEIPVDKLLIGASDIPATLSKLPGVRLIVTEPPPKGKFYNHILIEQLISGDDIRVEYPNRVYKFKSQAHLMILGDKKISPTNYPPAFWRRFVFLQLSDAVEGDNRISGEELLDKEGSAILSWFVNAAKDFYDMGEKLILPDSMLPPN